MADYVMDQAHAPMAFERGVQDVLGRPVDRIDGPAKTSGTARYAFETDDPAMLHGHVLTATVGRGRVLSLDTAAAAAMPGVVRIITDHPLIPRDGANGREDGLPTDHHNRIDFYGQPLGIVVAESFEQARAAARAVAVTYETGAGRFAFAATDEVEADPKGALLPNIRRGEMDAAMAAADTTFDRTYWTPHHYPAALEPHATVARWDGDHLTINASLQVLGGARRLIATTFDLEPGQVRVLAPYVGGGFGGKTGVGAETILAAIAAREIARPVKVVLSRRQTAQMVHHRSEAEQRVRIGTDAEGRIKAIGHDSVVTQKDDRTFIEPVAFGSLSLYTGETRSFTQALKRVDLPAAGAVRAPGEAIGTLALEAAMDEMAESLGLDPIDFRRMNEPDTDPLRSNRPFSTRRLLDCYDEGARRFGWSARNPTPGQVREGEWLVGLGMATALRGNFSVESQARVKLLPDGRAVIETDMTDIGTGTYTILAQVAAEALGLPVGSVQVVLGDTDLPPSAGSGGSFGAGSSGSAVALACEDIVEALAGKLGVAATDMTLKDGHAVGDNRRVALKDLLAGDTIEALGHLKPGANSQKFNQASHGAQFAEVAVNAVTGEIRVRRMLGVFDVGRVLNEKTARSQMIGGMIWGIGYVIAEEAVVDARTGQFMNPDFGEYHIAVSADVPQVECHFVQQPDGEANPVGAKAVGELGISGAGAAVVNAIYNATGFRPRSFPVTVDKLLAALPPV